MPLHKHGNHCSCLPLIVPFVLAQHSKLNHSAAFGVFSKQYHSVAQYKNSMTTLANIHAALPFSRFIQQLCRSFIEYMLKTVLYIVRSIRTMFSAAVIRADNTFTKHTREHTHTYAGSRTNSLISVFNVMENYFFFFCT